MVSVSSPAGQAESALDADSELLLSLLEKHKSAGTLSAIFKRKPTILGHALKSLDDDYDVLYDFLCKHKNTVGKFLEQHRDVGVLADFLAQYPAAMHHVLDEERSIVENFLDKQPEALHIYLDAKSDVLEKYLAARPQKLHNQVRQNPSLLSSFCDQHPRFMAGWLQNRQAAVQDYLLSNEGLFWNHIVAHPSCNNAARCLDGKFTASFHLEIPESQRASIRLPVELNLPKDIKAREKFLAIMAATGESLVAAPGTHASQDTWENDDFNIPQVDLQRLARQDSDWLSNDDIAKVPEALEWEAGRHLNVKGREKPSTWPKARQQDKTMAPKSRAKPSGRSYDMGGHGVQPNWSSQRRFIAKGDTFQAPQLFCLGNGDNRTQSHASSCTQTTQLQSNFTDLDDSDQDNDIMPSIELNAHELHPALQTPLLREQYRVDCYGPDNGEQSEHSSLSDTDLATGDDQPKRRSRRHKRNRVSSLRRSTRRSGKKQDDSDYHDDSDDNEINMTKVKSRPRHSAKSVTRKPRMSTTVSSQPQGQTATPWRGQPTTSVDTASPLPPSHLAVPYPAPAALLATEGDSVRRIGGWTSRQEDAAIRHMLAVRDEGQVNGEDRFKRAALRLNSELNLNRSWVSFKNFWNRTGRARSGFDERRTKNDTLATSLQGRSRAAIATNGRARSDRATIGSSMLQSVRTPSYSPIDDHQEEDGVGEAEVATAHQNVDVNATDKSDNDSKGQDIIDGVANDGTTQERDGTVAAGSQTPDTIDGRGWREGSEEGEIVEMATDVASKPPVAAGTKRKRSVVKDESGEMGDRLENEAYLRAWAIGTRQKKKVKYSS